MIKRRVAFLLVAVIVLSYASIDDYLFKNESKEDFKFVNYTYGGTNYTIAFKDGTPEFMTTGGTAVENSTTLHDVFYAYYSENYLPNETLFENISSLIDKFNQSRNDEKKFGFQGPKIFEEYACRANIRIEEIIKGKLVKSNYFSCADEKSCDYLGSVLAYIFKQDYNDMRDAAEKFYNATYSLDNSIQNARAYLTERDINHIYDSLKKASSEIIDAKSYALKVESTKFRVPSNDNPCTDCFSICPPIDLNTTYLDQAIDKIEQYLENAKPLENIAEKEKAFEKSEMERIEFYNNTTEKNILEKSAEQVFNEMEGLKQNLTNLSSFVKIVEIESEISNMENHKSEFEKAAKNFSFDVAKNELDIVSVLVKKAEEKYGNWSSVLQDLLEARKEAKVLEIKAMSADAIPENATEMISELEKNKGKKVSLKKAKEIAEGYKKASFELRKALTSEREDGIKKISKKYLKDAYELMSSIGREEWAVHLPTALGVFSFLSLSSVFVFVFSVKFSRLRRERKVSKRKRRNKSIIGSLILLGVLSAILMFSYFLYSNLSKYSKESSIDDFLMSLSKDDITYIIKTSSTVSECADRIADLLKSKGYNVETKTLCKEDECKGQKIVLRKKNERKVFASHILEKVLSFEGQKEDFEECFIYEAIKGGVK